MNARDSRGHNDPERTLQVLLRSMANDAPRPGAKQSVLTALGLGAAAVTAAGSAGAAGAVAVVAKFVVLGALASLVTTGVVTAVRHASPTFYPSPGSAAAHAVSAAPRIPRPDSPGRVPAAVPALAFTDPGQGQVSAAVPSTAARLRTPVAVMPSPAGYEAREALGAEAPTAVGDFGLEVPDDSSLRRETSQLDRARSAIAAGDAAQGLGELDRYEATFPHGALEPEATLLRIRALVMTGDQERARSLGRSFAAAHPQSPHLERVRSLLGP